MPFTSCPCQRGGVFEWHNQGILINVLECLVLGNLCLDSGNDKRILKLVYSDLLIQYYNHLGKCIIIHKLFVIKKSCNVFLLWV